MPGSLAEAQEKYKDLEARLNREIGKAQVLNSRKKELEQELEHYDGKIIALGKVLGLFHSLTEETQSENFKAIEEIVSSGLQSVFSTNYQFSIEQTIKGNVPSISFKLRDSTGVETPILGSRGGGVAAVTGVLLHQILTKLLHPLVAPILLMDEPFSQLSAEYVEPMAEMLLEQSRRLGIQTILITHQDTFFEYGDKAYRFELNEQGRTKVRQV